MSPMMDEMLVHDVVPRLRNVARTIPKIGHEDDEELIQDATLMAARMMDSAERCGLKDSAALLLKRRIAADLIEFFGEEVIRGLLDGVKPGWESDLRTVRDRHVCHVANGSDATTSEHR